MDSTLWIPDYSFPYTEFRIPKPTIPRSTSKDFLHFGFHKQKFCGFRNPGDLTWGRDTSGLPLCKNLWSGSFELTYQWLLCIHCFTSLVSFTGFYAEDEPTLRYKGKLFTTTGHNETGSLLWSEMDKRRFKPGRLQRLLFVCIITAAEETYQLA